MKTRGKLSASLLSTRLSAKRLLSTRLSAKRLLSPLSILMSLAIAFAAVPLMDMTPAVADNYSRESLSNNLGDNRAGALKLSAAIGIMPLAAYIWNSATPPTIIGAGSHTVTLSGTPSGTLNVPAGANVIIGGSIFGSAAATLTLNIASGASVQWAVLAYTGIASGSFPLISLPGNGTFEVMPGTWLWHMGSGNTIHATGASATIIVNGSVEANTGSGIEMTGANSTVTVQNIGSVFTDATSNLHPIINMTSASNTDANVFIKDNGSVWAMSDAGLGYGIQTYGNVIVDGGKVCSEAVNGRAINLVGENSVATINGGEISATGANGVAISTATTAGIVVTNASVSVNGGVVHATTGYAIRTTGANAKVTIGGDALVYNEATDGTGHPVLYTENGTNALITVEGSGAIKALDDNGYAVRTPGHVIVRDDAWISATTGNAIHVTGTTATVLIEGGMVCATTGNAIRSANAGATVTVDGGFVFAYGNAITGATNVISMAGTGIPTINTTTGNPVVVAWSQGATTYAEGLSTHLTVNPTGSATWHTNGTDNGIAYQNDINTGFFVLPVTVTTDYGLIFDVSSEKFYLDVDGNGVIAGDPEYTAAPVGSWSYAGGVLTLDGFSWTTTAPTALIIIGALTIDLADGSVNTFSVIGEQTALTRGIYAPSALSIEGDGTLNAVGGTQTVAADSVGIQFDSNITINGGIINAVGGANLSSGGSFGFYSALGSLSISGGTASATGSVAIGFGSFGVYTNSFTFSGGTIEALGNTQAIAMTTAIPPSVTAPAYTYWINAVDAANPGGFGELYGGGLTPYGIAFDNTADTYRYVKMSSGSFAIINNITVSGVLGVALVSSPSQYTTITLYGDTLLLALNGIVDSADLWFAAGILPDGLTVSADGLAGGDTITLTFSGTSEVTSAALFSITIPAGALNGNADITVEFNPDAKFDITDPTDDVPPTVIDLRPFGADVAINGNIEITFSEAIGTTGTISLNNGVGTLSAAGASWFGNTYIIPYSGLNYDTSYTISITGFADLNANLMTADSTHSFTTEGEPALVTYDVTVNNSFASSTGEGSYVLGASVTLNAGSMEGLSFIGWIVDNGGVELEDAENSTTTFVMPDNDVTVTARWRPDVTPPFVYVDASLTPLTAAFDKNTASANNEDVTVTLLSGSYTLVGIMFGAYTLQAGTDYVISGDSITIKKEYLATLAVGERVINFDMSGGLSPVLTVTVMDTTSTDEPETDEPGTDEPGTNDPDSPHLPQTGDYRAVVGGSTFLSLAFLGILCMLSGRRRCKQS